MFKNIILIIFYVILIKVSLAAITGLETFAMAPKKYLGDENKGNKTDFIELAEDFETTTEKNMFLDSVSKTTEEAFEESNTTVAEESKINFTEFIIFERLNMENNDTKSNNTDKIQHSGDKVLVNRNTEKVSQMYDGIAKMEQEIVLLRNNCFLELVVDDIHDLKVQIKFEPLKNNSAGKCFITLNGHRDSMLAVLISHIHLYKKVNEINNEILKVIVRNYNIDFVIKEYYDTNGNQPLLLTETRTVYLQLCYNTTTVTSTDYSRFNLEVFCYRKNEDMYRSNIKNNIYSNSHPTSLAKYSADKIFFTTEE